MNVINELLKRQRNQRSNCQCLLDHRKIKRILKDVYFCFIDYAKAFDCMDHNKLWKTLKKMGIPGHLTLLLRNLYAGQEATARSRHGTMDWFQIEKEQVHAVSMSTSCQMLGWMNHQLESRLMGEISITSDMKMTHSSGRK